MPISHFMYVYMCLCAIPAHSGNIKLVLIMRSMFGNVLFLWSRAV